MDREEALKIVRENYPHFGTTEPWLDLEKALATLIPELRESEDERIRKAIIEHFKQSETEFPGLTFGGYYYADVLAYLEKQKEQKPVDYEAELKKCKDNPFYFYDKYVSIKQKPAEWNDTDMKEARDNLISVCRDWERGELTTLLPIVATRARYFLEHLIEPQKPAESKVDVKVLKDIDLALRGLYDALQPKQEWSEEDERMMNGIRLVLESWDEAHSSIAGLPSLIPGYIDWLKSLRPSWKSSEEDEEPLSTF